MQSHGLIISLASVPKQNRHCIVGSSRTLPSKPIRRPPKAEVCVVVVPIGDDTSSSTFGGEASLGGEAYPSWDIIDKGRLPLLLHSSMNAPQERNTANRTCPGLMTSIIIVRRRRRRTKKREEETVCVCALIRERGGAEFVWRIFESAQKMFDLLKKEERETTT